ncbi:MAG: hypothetical protein ACRDTC_15380, partial [Pseudonocardiaceae bacterium]
LSSSGSPEKGPAVFTIFLTSCVASLVVLGGVVLLWLSSRRRARRAVPFGRHRGDALRAAGTVAPGVGADAGGGR